MEASIDVDDMVSQIYEMIYDTFDKFVPKSSIRITNKPKWHDKHLSHLKHFAENVSSRIEARYSYESYRKQCFSEFFRDQASNAAKNPRAFWNHINTKRKDNSIPAKIIYIMIVRRLHNTF